MHDYDARSTAAEVTRGLDLSGRIFLLTGCNSGLGLETLRVLVSGGARVLAFARTLPKAERACEDVAGAGRGRATPIVCDLADLQKVADCARQVGRMTGTLDGIICNAGVELRSLKQIGGIEKQLVVNHLSHFLLVNLLTGLLRRAPQGRVVMVSSSLAYLRAPDGGIQFDNLAGEGGYDRGVHALYAQSKLANVLFSNELARRLASPRVTSNALHPGYINTRITRDFPRSFLLDAGRKFRSIARYMTLPGRRSQMTKTVEQGAATTCFVATRPSLDRVSGRYFEGCVLVQKPASCLVDVPMAQRLWRVSADLPGNYPEGWA